MIKTAIKEGNTADIIYAMALIAPAAIAQAIKFNLPAVIGLTGANLQKDAILTGKWIRANVTYKIDPFTDQNIQLPSSLLKHPKNGDCKSISMLYLAAMEAAGYNGGFRFAGYRNNNFTHVYNYFLDSKDNIFTFDGCIKDLVENQTYTKIKDMRINYIAGAPVMITEINKPMKRIKTKVAVSDLMKDDRYASITGIGKTKKKFFKKLGDAVKKAGKIVKTAALAPARGPFLVLVNFNVFGLASKFKRALAKNQSKVLEFWTKLGGDDDKFLKSINAGAAKKPHLVKKGVNGVIEDYDYLGEPVTIATALTTAAGIIAAAMKLFKSLGIKKKEGEQDESEVIDPETPVSEEVEKGEDFFANDPASEGAAKYAESGGAVKPKAKPQGKPSGKGMTASADLGGDGTGFTPSPLMIGAAAAGILGIYLLTKKKK